MRSRPHFPKVERETRDINVSHLCHNMEGNERHKLVSPHLPLFLPEGTLDKVRRKIGPDSSACQQFNRPLVESSVPENPAVPHPREGLGHGM